MGQVVASTLLVVAFGLLVPHRWEGGPGWYGLSPDAQEYVQMVEEGVGAGDLPFRSRPLAPWLASLLPLSGPSALQMVTWTSMWLYFLVTFELLRSCGEPSFISRLLGIMVLTSTTSSSLVFQNPHLTDAFGLLSVAVALCGLLSKTPWLFLGALVGGILARENVLFLLPGAFGTPWRPAHRWLIVALSLAAFAAPRLLSPEGSYVGFYAAAFDLPDFETAAKVYVSYGAVWLLGAAGLVRSFRTRVEPLAWALAGSLIGHAVAISVTTDVTRLLVYMAPFVLVGTTRILSELRHTHRREAWLFAAVLSLGVFMALPTKVTLALLPGLGSIFELEEFYLAMGPIIAGYHLLALAWATTVVLRKAPSSREGPPIRPCS